MAKIIDEFKATSELNEKKFRCVTLDETLESTVNRVIESGTKSTAVQDAYRNTLSATGTADKVDSFSSYGFNNDTLNWPLWLALYNDSWVFRRAIDKPSQDMINSGFTIHGDEDYSVIYKHFNKYKFDLIKLLQWGSLFGGSIAVMMFDSVPDEEMRLPLVRAKITGARMKLYVTDRWYGVSPSDETVTDMRDIDYGKPKYYNVTFADGKMYTIHHSYVLRYEHRSAPQLIKNGQLQGWGYAEGAHILNELSRDDQLKSAITSLVNKSLIEVIKMSGMRGVFMGADKGTEEQLRKRLEMVNWGRTYNSLTFLDKDDEYDAREFSGATGLSQLLETNMWLVAAAVEMQGVLFGDMKGGLSQESDAMRRYAVTIKNRCDSYLRPVLQKLLMIICIINGMQPQIDFEFNSLVAVEENNEKMDAINKCSETVGALVKAGIISKYQAAQTLNTFINRGVLSIQFTDEIMNNLKLEEQASLLTNKTPEQAMVESQFPNVENLPEKLQYLKNEGEPVEEVKEEPQE